MTMLTKIRTIKQNLSDKWTTPLNIYEKDEALAEDKRMEKVHESKVRR